MCTYKKQRLGHEQKQMEDHEKTEGKDSHLYAKEKDLKKNQLYPHLGFRILVYRIVAKYTSVV